MKEEGEPFVRRGGAGFEVVAESNQPEVLRQMVLLGVGWTVLSLAGLGPPDGLRVVRRDLVDRRLVVARRAGAGPDVAVDELAAALAAGAKEPSRQLGEATMGHGSLRRRSRQTGSQEDETWPCRVQVASAVVEPDLDTSSALDLAAGADDLPPFFGVPIPVEDLHAVAGWPCTYGSHGASDAPAAQSGLVVQRLEDAGFLLCGMTNSPEFGTVTATENDRYGITRNPWDLERTSGVSSVGASAAVAGGMFTIAHASDGGVRSGSRRPAPVWSGSRRRAVASTTGRRRGKERPRRAWTPGRWRTTPLCSMPSRCRTCSPGGTHRCRSGRSSTRSAQIPVISASRWVEQLLAWADRRPAPSA